MVIAAVPSWSWQSVEPLSQPSMDESRGIAQRVVQEASFPAAAVPRGDNCPSVACQGRKWLQIHLQQGLQRQPQRCWLSLRTVAMQESFNEAFWIPSLTAAAGYRIICMLMS